MTKTLNLELSKRLTPFLKGVETEYAYVDRSDELFIEASDEDKKHKIFRNIFVLEKVNWEYWEFKTLTLEEAIEFLPRTHTSIKWDFRIEIEKHIDIYRLTIYTVDFANEKWGVDYISSDWKRLWIWQKTWKTQLEAIETMLTYLLDNNLLKKWLINNQ